jgi:heterotetrameric sarcosine oxidase delta subunit
MLQIPCPWCGPRDEIEFRYGGEAHVAYPDTVSSVDDGELARYIFYRGNPKGRFQERWVHQHGCRRWFNVVRDTVTHEIAGSYRAGEEPPA